MKQVLAVSVVYDWYQDFIPTYLASLLISYPEYYAKIFVEGELTGHNRDAIAYVRTQISSAFKIEREFTPQWSGQAKKAERWILDEEVFAGFLYAWITDIDMLIVREYESLLFQERKRAQAIGLPYANVVRETDTRRLSGTMFIEIGPYFGAMRRIIAEAREDPSQFIADDPTKTQGWNEMLLKEMVRRGIGVLEPDKDRPYTSARMHGVHLGALRVRGRHKNCWRNDPLRRHIRTVLEDRRFRIVEAMASERVRRLFYRLRAWLDFDEKEWQQQPGYSPEPTQRNTPVEDNEE